MIPALAFVLALTGAPPRDEDKPTERLDEGRVEPQQHPERPKQRRARRERGRNKPRPRAPATALVVPVDIGVGPALLLPNGPAFDSQPVFTALSLSLAAVIDQELIAKNRGRIPPGLRGAARRLDEVRYRPWYLSLVPELVVVSPQLEGLSTTGMYGAVWRPIGIGVSLVDDPVRLAVGAHADLAWLFLHSKTLGGGSSSAQSVTHLLRPGVGLELVLEIPVTESFLVSTGWSSDLFVPQPLGRPPWEVFPVDDALWHLGGPFLKLHVRVPYTVDSSGP